MELLAHNLKTFNQVLEFVSRREDCCVVNPCGSGKSSIMAAIVRAFPDKTFTIFTKQGNAGDYYHSLDKAFTGSNVTIHTYMKMHGNYKSGKTEIYDTDFFLVDEAHYVGADKWGEAFRVIREKYNPIVIGFTATPQRFAQQGTEETVVGQFFSGNSAGNYTAADLQKKGLFQEPEYVLSIYDMEETAAKYIAQIEASDLSETRKDAYIRKLEETLEDWKQNSCPEKVISEVIPRFLYKPADNRILVYVPSIQDLDSRSAYINGILTRIFPGRRIRSYSYTYKDRKSVLQDFCRDDGKTYIRIMYSIDRIMETIHIDDLNIAVMMRPAVSERIIIQQFGRLNSIGNDKKPLIIDMVDNLSNLGSISFVNVGGHGSNSCRSDVATAKIRTNLHYVSRYRSLFAEIDAVGAKTKLMTVDGFTGTLSQICTVMRRDIEEVKARMQKGDTVEEALQHTKKKKVILRSSLDGIPKCDISDIPENMPEIPRERMDGYIRAVRAFAESRKIRDEDTLQNLYLLMMKELRKYPDIKRGHLILRLSPRYAALERDRRTRAGMFDERPMQGMEYSMYTAEDVGNEAVIDILTEEFRKSLKTALKPREQVILRLRYGDGMTLAEIGRELSLTGESIRKIEAKALRRLRRPSFVMDFHDLDDSLSARKGSFAN